MFPKFVNKRGEHDSLSKQKFPFAIANLALFESKHIPLIVIKRARYILKQVSDSCNT